MFEWHNLNDGRKQIAINLIADQQRNIFCIINLKLS